MTLTTPEKISEITEEQLDLITPVIEAVNAFKPYAGIKQEKHTYIHENNFPVGDYGCRADLGELSAVRLYGHLKGFETFFDLVPMDYFFGEGNVHTIKEIKLFNCTPNTLLTCH